MTASIPIFELFGFAGILVAAGIITGFFAGLFGVGGGAIIVPVLYDVFRVVGVPEDVRMPLCVGTSLAIIIPTSIMSFRAHRKRGAVDASILRQWAIPVVIGVVLGSGIARHAPEQLFKIVFVVIAGISGIRMLFASNGRRIADDFPTGLLMKCYGFIIGVLSTLMGIGGGQLSNLFMMLYGRPIHQAIATSSGLGLLISIPATLGYVYAGWSKMAEYPAVAALRPPYTLGYVSLLGAILVMPTSIPVAPLGAKLAHKLKRRQLEIAFGIFPALGQPALRRWSHLLSRRPAKRDSHNISRCL